MMIQTRDHIFENRGSSSQKKNIDPVMDVDAGAAGRGGKERAFLRLGGSFEKSQKVCFNWRAGRCYRRPCPFLHGELPSTSSNGLASKRSHGLSDDPSFSGSSSIQRRFYNDKPNTQFSSKWGRGHGGGGGIRVPPKTQDKVCTYWLAGKCSYGDKCKYLHSWFVSDEFSLLTQLEGHRQLISGITFPSGSDKLYSGSKDESVRVWDCNTGQCVHVLNMGAEIGCMINEGPWIFVGMANFVKAWNTQTSIDLSLNGPVGQVYALVVGNDMLFAGTQDGSILAWKFIVETNCFQPAAALKDHSLAVVSLVVGGNRLYSGSMDNTIRVWDLESLQCIQTLTDHTSVVMSVLRWDQFLLSCSLDNTIKVWAATESGNLEVTYTHTEEHGVLTLCGMHDAQAKPVLLCSCNNNSVRLYDLPSFNERGKIFSKGEVRAIEIGPGGIFFTGDATGELKVWKWAAE